MASIAPLSSSSSPSLSSSAASASSSSSFPSPSPSSLPWHQFLLSSKQLYCSHPLSTRYLYKYRPADHTITLTVTDGRESLHFTTSSANELKVVDRVHSFFSKLMTAADPHTVEIEEEERDKDKEKEKEKEKEHKGKDKGGKDESQSTHGAAAHKKGKKK